MKKVLFFALALLVLVGCGGGGDSFDNRTQFEGFWSGTVVGGSNPAENMQISVNSNGNISGSESVNGRTAALTGFVEQDGTFQMTSRLSGEQDVVYQGDMYVNSNNRLIGQGTATQGSTTVNLSFNLQRQ
ncbi:MAG TPA: hypothetical protein VK934_11045 [Fimbriimonas sp.]|nr:hypothetical protein [Fimbriimonas sp.]